MKPFEKNKEGREKLASLLSQLYKTADENELISLLQKECDRRDVEKQLPVWKSMAEGLCEIYPSFSLEDSLSDKAFFSLLYAGLDVKSAYELIHKDEIIFSLLEKAAMETVLRAKELRNGAVFPAFDFTGAGTVKGMTKKQREKLIERASNGENVIL